VTKDDDEAATPQASGTVDDFVGLRGFEVGGTITTGVRIYCIHCEQSIAEWSSRDKYPRVAEMVEACENHALNEHQPEALER
jgi:hypothetical protein